MSAYESIATASGTGSSDTISFNTIPTEFRHLQLILSTRNTVAADFIAIRFNNDTTDKYDMVRLYGSGGNGTSRNGISINSSAGLTYIELPANAFAGTGNSANLGATVVDLLDYQQTNKFKPVRAIGGFALNSSNNIVCQWGGEYRSTSAITSIQIYVGGGGAAFTTTSRISLYGLKG